MITIKLELMTLMLPGQNVTLMTLLMLGEKTR